MKTGTNNYDVNRNEHMAFCEQCGAKLSPDVRFCESCGARYYYHESMKGINSIKAVLPAVLKSSADIRRRYSKRIYGSEIPSLNIPPKDAISLICSKDDGTVENPYKKLPPVATYFPEGSGKLVEAQERLLEDVKNGGAALAAYGLCKRPL